MATSKSQLRRVTTQMPVLTHEVFLEASAAGVLTGMESVKCTGCGTIVRTAAECEVCETIVETLADIRDNLPTKRA